MVLSSYSAAMIIAGGSGVTFALSEAEEVVQMLHRGKSRIRFIEVVWITQDMSQSSFRMLAFLEVRLIFLLHQTPSTLSSKHSPLSSPLVISYPTSF